MKPAAKNHFSALSGSRVWFLLGMVGILASRMDLFGQSTAFTYQGRLSDGGGPANGYYNLSFGLYPTNVGGIPAGSILTNNSVAVSNGLFTTVLDFGPVFDGTPYWLEIGVQSSVSTNDFTVLSPRQALNSSPYSTYAAKAGTVTGVLAATNLPASVALLNGSPNFSGTITAPGFAGDGSGLTNLNASQLTSGTVPDARLSTNVALLNGNNNWTGTNNFANGLSTGSNFISTYNGSNSAWQLMQRAVINSLPVPTFRPKKTNTVLALDGMPNGNPGDSGYGLSWLDWCLEDCQNANGIIHSIHLATHSSTMEISSVSYNGGIALPLAFGTGNGLLSGESFPLVINSSGQVVITNPVIFYNYKPAFFTNYSATTNDTVLFCNGTNQVVSLPSLNVPVTKIFSIICVSTNGSIIVTNSNGYSLINGGLSQTLGPLGSGTNRLSVIYDGGNYQ
jgi:hypothetical protein